MVYALQEIDGSNNPQEWGAWASLPVFSFCIFSLEELNKQWSTTFKVSLHIYIIYIIIKGIILYRSCFMLLKC